MRSRAPCIRLQLLAAVAACVTICICQGACISPRAARGLDRTWEKATKPPDPPPSDSSDWETPVDSYSAPRNERSTARQRPYAVEEPGRRDRCIWSCRDAYVTACRSQGLTTPKPAVDREEQPLPECAATAAGSRWMSCRCSCGDETACPCEVTRNCGFKDVH